MSCRSTPCCRRHPHSKVDLVHRNRRTGPMQGTDRLACRRCPLRGIPETRCHSSQNHRHCPRSKVRRACRMPGKGRDRSSSMRCIGCRCSRLLRHRRNAYRLRPSMWRPRPCTCCRRSRAARARRIRRSSLDRRPSRSDTSSLARYNYRSRSTRRRCTRCQRSTVPPRRRSGGKCQRSTRSPTPCTARPRSRFDRARRKRRRRSPSRPNSLRTLPRRSKLAQVSRRDRHPDSRHPFPRFHPWNRPCRWSRLCLPSRRTRQRRHSWWSQLSPPRYRRCPRSRPNRWRCRFLRRSVERRRHHRSRMPAQQRVPSSRSRTLRAGAVRSS